MQISAFLKEYQLCANNVEVDTVNKIINVRTENIHELHLPTTWNEMTIKIEQILKTPEKLNERISIPLAPRRIKSF